ncbi:Esterase/lipase superfamily enzyme [Nakamurella panacisegetis]|uniref:Esterase/lipase superfamily enzyme n=1 Tax=Nakamurella panacisegetis TaxID=1090615 RepID=A0A1H0R1C7_9ACTN|nr:alpha/beta hydrolase-fold protein [Nakamurella panacisegetis]SDP22808.1 Esterase/lipase superfamily enzyme [Nakamurella panacisegetis]
MTRTEYHHLDAPSWDGPRELAVHGHWGRPVLWFPTEGGGPSEFEANGMLDALGPAIDDGKLKIFCVPSYDDHSWSNRDLRQGDRARAHRRFEDWILWSVVPFIREQCGGRDDIVTAGASIGAFHSVLFALRHAHVFHRAVGFSGAYDPWAWHAWGDSDDDTYLTDPVQFLPRTYGGHLEHLRRSLYLTLVVSSGRWEDTTGANASTRKLDAILGDKQIPHEMHVWGPEWPHDWPSWRAQAATYLPPLG